MALLKYWDGTQWVSLSMTVPAPEVYTQPDQPATTTIGAIWIDTDAPPASGYAMISKVTAPYTVTSGYTADRAFNPENSSVTEVARTLGTLIDDLRAAGLLT